MAKIKASPLIEELHGRIGDLVFRRIPNGDMMVSKAPDMSHVAWSEAQRTHRERFRRAISYARAAMADPTVSGIYQQAALAQGKLPFRLAVSDYFKGIDLLQDGR